MGFGFITLEDELHIPTQEWGIVDLAHLIPMTSSDMLDLGLPISAGIALVDSDTYVDQSILIDGFEGLSNPIADICERNGLSPHTEKYHTAPNGTRVTYHAFDLGHLISLSIQDEDGRWTLQNIYAESAALYLKILGIKTRDLNPGEAKFIDIPTRVFLEELTLTTPFDHDQHNRPYFTDIKSDIKFLQIQDDIHRNHISIFDLHFSKKEDPIPDNLIEKHHLEVYDQAMAGPFFSRLQGKYTFLQAKLAAEGIARELKYKIIRDSKIIFYENNTKEKRGVLIERLYIDEQIPIDNGYVVEHQYYRVPGYIKSEIVYDDTAQRYVIESTKATHPHALELYDHFDNFDQCENLDVVLKTIGAKKENTVEKIDHCLEYNTNIPDALGRAGFWPISIPAGKQAHIGSHPLRDIIRQENTTITTEATPITKEINNAKYIFILEHDIQFAALTTGRHSRFEVVSVFHEIANERIFAGMYVSTGWQELVKGMVKNPTGIGTPMRSSLAMPSTQSTSDAHQQYNAAITILKNNTASGGDSLKDQFSYIVAALDPQVLDPQLLNDKDFLFLASMIVKTVALLSDDTGSALTEYEAFISREDDLKKFSDILNIMKDIALKKRELSTPVGKYKQTFFNLKVQCKTSPILEPLYSALVDVHSEKLNGHDLSLLTRVIESSIARVKDPTMDSIEYIAMMGEIAGKSYYKNNKLLAALFFIFTITCIAALAMIAPPVAAVVGLEFAAGYYVGTSIVTGVFAIVTREKINRWSPLYDAMNPMADISSNPTYQKPTNNKTL